MKTASYHAYECYFNSLHKEKQRRWLFSCYCKSAVAQVIVIVERSGSGVGLRTLDYENPGSNPGCGVKTLGKFFHSTLLQFTQLNK